MKFKKFIKESIETPVETDTETKVVTNVDESNEAVKDYRKFANIVDESFTITEDNIDDWALNEAACKNGIQKYDLKHMLLNEDKTIDQAARELEAEEHIVTTKNQVEEILDDSLKIALRKQRRGDEGDFPNILLISDAGFGKTDMVRQWAKKNNINLVQKNLGTMGAEAFGGIVTRDSDDPRYATRIGTNEMIKELSAPRSVLFLDEYNRSKTEIRGAVLTLVQNHMIWDPTAENNERHLDNFLFTVAAINPPNAAYKGAKELDAAEKSRFYSYPMQPDPMEHLRYLKGYYTKKIATTEDKEEKLEYQGMIDLAETILSDPAFKYDTGKDIEDHMDDASYRPLNYRSFKLALDRSGGTKEGLLRVWSNFCNYSKKSTIERILANYVDVKDKANDALADGTDSDVFGETEDNYTKLLNMFPELND